MENTNEQYLSEFDEWIQKGLEKAKDIIDNKKHQHKMICWCFFVDYLHGLIFISEEGNVGRLHILF